jgi:hypothetical protein
MRGEKQLVGAILNQMSQRREGMNSIHRRFADLEIYRCAPVSTGNTFQDPPRLSETADNTERYM